MPDIDLDDYFTDFQNALRAAASADENFTEEIFVEEMSRRLSEAEEVDSLLPMHYSGTGAKGKKRRIDAFDLSDEEGQVVLAVADFKPGDTIETVSTVDARNQFASLNSFVELALSGALLREVEESSDAYQLAVELAQRKSSLHKIRLYLLTNGKLGDRVRSFESTSIDGIVVEFHLWDIERLHRVEMSQLGREEIDIDLTEWAPAGIPVLLSGGVGLDGVSTYLTVMPGRVLAAIYRKYGGRVLEANVRAFLSARGNVNRGIRGTVLQQPEMFLAYNNGISATAASVSVVESDGSSYLRGVTDLQIVNGGQTTASLFYTEKNDGADLSGVGVQMKLIVVDSAKAADLVPKISRYANTQNRVSEADFFSNHPFHIRMEDKSRRLLAPARPGSAFQTKWFYERARGQYLNERAKVTAAQAKRFEAEYPRNQLMTKTDSAKYIMSWQMQPHIVSAGAQKNFLAFAASISATWEKDDAFFGDEYFKDLVAKNILFNAVRLRVMKADWYSSGYLANIVTYTIAKLADTVAKHGVGGTFDFARIWRDQSVNEALLSELVDIAHMVTGVLTSPDRPVVNVTEWAKREACWRAIAATDVVPKEGLNNYVVQAADARAVAVGARRLQRVDTGIGAQIRVNELGSRYWVRLRDFGREMKVLSSKDLDIIRYGTGEAGRLPSEAQANYLVLLSAKMEDIGYAGK